MDTVVVLISQPKINFDTLKSILTNQMESNIVSLVDQLPVTISQEAEFLIYVTAITNEIKDPLYILKNLPLHVLQSLHYTMMIASDAYSLIEFISATGLTPYSYSYNNEDIVTLVTGTLDIWYTGITQTLANNDHYLSIDTYRIFDMCMVVLENAGLELIFGKFTKNIVKRDKLFYLESK